VHAVPGSLTDVLPAVAALVGVDQGLDLRLDQRVDRLDLRSRVGDVRRVCVLLVDGMGFHLLPAMAPHAPLLAEVLRGATGSLTELACTLPSTTPTSLVSFGTGAQPGEHGVLGFTLNIPGTDRVLTHIVWRADPPPDQWQPVRTWFQRLVGAGADATAVLPEAFLGSGLTEAAYRGARMVGVRATDDYAERLLAELPATRGLVYGYTSALDTAAHVFGIDSPEWAAAAAGVDALLTRLVEGLPADAALIVTADHGGLDIAADARIDLDADPRLNEGLAVVAGEPRLRYLHTVDGATGDVLERWRAVLGSRAMVLGRDEAIDTGWFGPVPAAHRLRIGDVVVVCTDPVAILASRHEPPEVGRLVGFHGAATAAETAIPLITVRG
jgi:hypothetical protein